MIPFERVEKGWLLCMRERENFFKKEILKKYKFKDRNHISWIICVEQYRQLNIIYLS